MPQTQRSDGVTISVPSAWFSHWQSKALIMFSCVAGGHSIGVIGASATMISREEAEKHWTQEDAERKALSESFGVQAVQIGQLTQSNVDLKQSVDRLTTQLREDELKHIGEKP